MDPPVSEWKKASESEDQTQTVYQANGYTLVLKEEQDNGHTVVEFNLKRDSGDAFTINKYALTAESSCVGLQRVWIPYRLNFHLEAIALIRCATDVAEEECVSSADRRIPLIVGMDRAGKCLLAVGFLDQRIETRMKQSVRTHFPSAQDRGTMRFHLERPIEGHSMEKVTKHKDGFFVSTGSSWFDTVQVLRSIHDKKTGAQFRPSPDPAWEPLWAPWGATKGNWKDQRPEALGPDELWEMVKLGSELGIRGLVNWTSWSNDALDSFQRDEEFRWSYPDSIGDFVACSKFPDLKGFVRKLKSIGIMSLFWISPWMAGRETRVRKELKEALADVDMDRSDPLYRRYTSYLCPRNPITQKYVPELMARVLKEYGADGYTVDVVDAASMAKCTADHEHNYSSLGLAVADTFKNIRKAIDAVNPKAVIEFRQRYSNISNIYNATAHRSCDSGEGGSFDMNRRNCLMLRSYIPPGVAVHNDPVWWHIKEENKTVAKMLSTMVVSGVPQVGADLINMTDDHRKLLKVWLSFYQAHKEDFRHGQMRPVQNDPEFSTILVENGRKVFVSYASYPALKVALKEGVGEIYLFNCTNEDYLYTILLNISGDFSATLYSYDLSLLSERKLSAIKQSLLVDEAVPQGGYILLRKMSI